MKKFFLSVLCSFLLVFFVFGNSFVSFAASEMPVCPIAYTHLVKFDFSNGRSEYYAFQPSDKLKDSGFVIAPVSLNGSDVLWGFYVFSPYYGSDVGSAYSCSFANGSYSDWYPVSKSSGSSDSINLYSFVDANSLSLSSYSVLSGSFYIWTSGSNNELISFVKSNYSSLPKGDISIHRDSDLGSFVMASGQNSWANNFFGEFDFKGVFTSRVQKFTSTGKNAGVDFDNFQYYCGLSDCKRVGMFPKSFGTFVDNSVHVGSGLKNGRGGLALDVSYPDDFVSALQQLMQTDSGFGNSVQACFNKLLGGDYEFKPIVFLRPFDSKSGAYGDWIRVTSGPVSSTSMNSSGTGSSVSGSSSEDPDSTSFSQNSDSVATTGTTASGTTLDNAINNAITFSPVVNVNPDINVNVNNNVSNELQQIQNASSSSGGQVTGGILSNIVGLLGLVGAVPQMLTVLFSWLPAWSLAVVGVAFALFVPVIIFKLLK